MPIRLVSGLLSETLRLFLQQYRSVRLRQEEKKERCDRKSPYCLNVFGPAPAKMGVNKQGRSNEWALYIINNDSLNGQNILTRVGPPTTATA